MDKAAFLRKKRPFCWTAASLTCQICIPVRRPAALC